MITFSVQSGSNGNSIYYESKGIKLLFDAGITYKCLNERLSANNIDPKDINALFISHDHSDHSKNAGVFQRKIKMPIFISPKTFKRVEYTISPVEKNKIEHFIPDDTINLGHIKIHTIRTPHDGIEPAIFIVDDGETRVGIFTDLGYCFEGLINAMHTLDVIYLEANYDLNMLRNNREYPEELKRRIIGNGGHISNKEGGALVRDFTDGKLKHLYLSHLSENNNTPILALNTHKEIYKNNYKFELSLAPRNTFSKPTIL